MEKEGVFTIVLRYLYHVMMVVNSYCLSFSLNVWMRSCYVILLFMLQTSPLHLLGCSMEYSIGENLSLRK